VLLIVLYVAEFWQKFFIALLNCGFPAKSDATSLNNKQANCAMPAVNCLLSTVNCLLSTACCHPTTAVTQQLLSPNNCCHPTTVPS
jgi:hypothetical protein